MTTAKLIKDKSNVNLSEIFQSIDLKFAFVTKKDNTYSQIHQEGKCRDFLGDILWSKYYKKPMCMYGMSYDHSKAPKDEDKLRLSLQFPDGKALEIFLKNEKYLFNKETLANTEPHKIILTDNKLCIIIEADPLWQEAIWKLSLFTFYIKVCSYESECNLQRPENEYIKILTNEIEYKFLNKIKDCGKELIHENTSYAHNYSGFVTIVQGNSIYKDSGNANKMYNLLQLGEENATI